MDLITDVYNLAEQFTKNPQYVTIDDTKLIDVAQTIKNNPPNPNSYPLPKIEWSKKETEQISQTIFYELLAGSVNYKYWYGKSDIRPNGSNANKMYEVLIKSWNEVGYATGINAMSNKWIIDTFIKNLIKERFPMIEERIKHLREIENRDLGITFVNKLVDEIISGKENVETQMPILLNAFPGYAQDPFLKRASLFFMMLYRSKGFFKTSISKLHIPADYQIPKILRHMGVLKYSLPLCLDIKEGKLIPEESLQECEIRASTIIASKKITEIANITNCQVDDYLWLNRKITSDPFHLTITTNY